MAGSAGKAIYVRRVSRDRTTAKRARQAYAYLAIEFRKEQTSLLRCFGVSSGVGRLEGIQRMYRQSSLVPSDRIPFGLVRVVKADMLAVYALQEENNIAQEVLFRHACRSLRIWKSRVALRGSVVRASGGASEQEHICNCVHGHRRVLLTVAAIAPLAAPPFCQSRLHAVAAAAAAATAAAGPTA